MPSEYKIDIAKEFKCLAKDCPYTCCRGWQILIDEETYDRYRALRGIRGRFYRFQFIKKEPKRIKKIFGKCPFFTSDRLCLHQCTGETSLMPAVCRKYPRRIEDFGSFKEATLELSCPAAAQLFLDNPGPRSFVESDTPLTALWEQENDDEEFLGFLKNERDELLELIWSGESLPVIWENAYKSIYEQHEKLTRDKLSEAKEIKPSILCESKKGYAFFAISTIDHMLLGHVDRGGLIFKVPAFYRLIRRYLKTFSKMTVAGADRYFNEKALEMMENQSHLELKYRSYFAYALQQELMLSYESYSLIREFLFCILYTQLLILFDMMEYIKKKSISRTKETQILYLTEHNIRHNPYLRKQLYNVIREEFF